MKRKAQDDPNPSSGETKLKNITRTSTEDGRSEKHLATRVSNMRPVHPKTAKFEEEKFTDLEDGRFKNERGEVFVKAIKAYKSKDFLNSRRGRLMRIMCEYEETEQRLEEQGVHHTILVFGSARARSHADWEKQVEVAKQERANAQTPEKIEKCDANLLRLRRLEWMCEYFDKLTELCRRLAEWGSKQPIQFHISSGGGPGLMEATNKGAHLAGQKSIGMGISLPFEPGLNQYVTPDLAFCYHYFFTRKFWMSYPSRVLIVAPGGFGTCDELFELLTLQQTGKKQDTPIVCLGKKFWQSVINIDAMVEFGTVSPRDAKRLYFTDSVDEAFDYVTKKLGVFVEQELNKAEN